MIFDNQNYHASPCTEYFYNHTLLNSLLHLGLTLTGKLDMITILK